MAVKKVVDFVRLFLYSRGMKFSSPEAPHEDAIADKRLYARLQREAWAREEAEMLAKAATREDVLKREPRVTTDFAMAREVAR